MQTESPRDRLSLRQRCIARGRAYDLLGDLIRSGPRRLEHLRTVTTLVPHLPDQLDDDVAAEHFRVFGQQIPPYESVFLETNAKLGGETSTAVHRVMSQAGFVVDAQDITADHISNQLAYLAYLCAAEADAWRDDLPETATSIEDLSRQFLDAHALRWFAPLHVAVSGVCSGLYQAATGLVLALATDHLGRTPSPFTLPEPPELLSNPKTGIRQIADFLAVPALSGAMLSPQVVRQLGRDLQIPCGFGQRSMLLENLLQSAIRSDRLSLAVAALRQSLAEQQGALSALSGGETWARRTQSTIDMLSCVSAAAQTASPPP